MVSLDSVPEWVLDPVYPGTLLALVSLLAVWPALDESRWQVRVEVRAREHDDLTEACAASYDRRPRAALYQLAPYLVLGRRIRTRRDRLVARATQAARMPQMERELGMELAREWLHSVGRFSRWAGLERQIALRRFLQTNHLNIVREGSICLPFVILALSKGELNREEEELARWGVALLDRAAFYNSVARQQRQAVYMDVAGITEPVGPVLNAPRRSAHPYYNVLDFLMRDLALSPKSGERARHRLSSWTSALQRTRDELPGHQSDVSGA